MRPALYLTNSALLTTHEIDSAFWHEWKMFRIPGELPVFLLLNLVLVAVMLHGYRQVVLGRPTATRWTLLLAAAGGLTLIAHLMFLIAGRPEFHAPASLVLLGLIGAVSLSQVLYEMRTARDDV